MVVGDIVKRKGEEIYGVVKDSPFGLAIAFWENNNDDKTAGLSISALKKYWDVIDGLPEGYAIDQYGLPVKMIK